MQKEKKKIIARRFKAVKCTNAQNLGRSVTFLIIAGLLN